MTPVLVPLAQHLWQSTVILAAAWLLIRALRPARARVRYWIWFAASMKFMVPFAALTWIGGQVAWRAVCGVRGTVELTAEGATMWQLALVLGRRLGVRVVDETGLDARFDFRLDLAAVELSGAGLTEQTNNRRLAVGNALREQLGLDLIDKVVQVPILVIDSVERPSLDR
jgi:Protein of unknown function (DUF3738)